MQLNFKNNDTVIKQLYEFYDGKIPWHFERIHSRELFLPELENKWMPYSGDMVNKKENIRISACPSPEPGENGWRFHYKDKKFSFLFSAMAENFDNSYGETSMAYQGVPIYPLGPNCLVKMESKQKLKNTALLKRFSKLMDFSDLTSEVQTKAKKNIIAMLLFFYMHELRMRPYVQHVDFEQI